MFGRYQRPTPYIYRDDEISRLLKAAAKLPSKTGLRPHTFTTLFGLYAVTGLRCQEPLQLDRHDIDWRSGVLTVRGAKFGKSPLVPLHPTTVEALRAYAACRDRLCGDPESPSFFLSDRGARLTHWAVRATFVTLSHRIGLRSPGDSYGPRLHDLRHRMAVNTLLRWYPAILIPAERRGGLGWEGFSRRIEGEGSFGIGQAVEQVGPRGEDEAGGEDPHMIEEVDAYGQFRSGGAPPCA